MLVVMEKMMDIIVVKYEIKMKNISLPASYAAALILKKAQQINLRRKMIILPTLKGIST